MKRVAGAPRASSLLWVLAVPLGCSDGERQRAAADASPPGVVVEGPCAEARLGLDGGNAVDHLRTLGCTQDFEALASDPIDSTLPGARSTKVVYDTAQADGALYFQNSVLYPVHYDFVSTHLSGGTLPVVPQLASFNTTEYYSPSRRFILGAVTYYEGAAVWALELSPYDTASPAMITALFQPSARRASSARPSPSTPLRRPSPPPPRSCRATCRSSPPTSSMPASTTSRSTSPGRWAS